MTRGRFGSRTESEHSAFTNALAIFGSLILKFAVMLDVAIFLASFPFKCTIHLKEDYDNIAY